MASTSEIRLMKLLHHHDYRLMRSPSSGTGIEHPETGERMDSPDVVAIKEIDGCHHILAIEEKNVQPPLYIDSEQVEALVAWGEDTGAEALIGYHWKHHAYPHSFMRPSDLLEAGENYKIDPDKNGELGVSVEEIVR